MKGGGSADPAASQPGSSPGPELAMVLSPILALGPLEQELPETHLTW